MLDRFLAMNSIRHTTGFQRRKESWTRRGQQMSNPIIKTIPADIFLTCTPKFTEPIVSTLYYSTDVSEEVFISYYGSKSEEIGGNKKNTLHLRPKKTLGIWGVQQVLCPAPAENSNGQENCWVYLACFCWINAIRIDQIQVAMLFFFQVGGWATPLKNDGLRQLGWLYMTPIFLGKKHQIDVPTIHHQAVFVLTQRQPLWVIA